MVDSESLPTPQEEFWAGGFGDAYIARNRSDQLLASNLAFFTRVLRRAAGVTSIVEFGANIGMNLKALSLVCPGADLYGVEINKRAAEELATVIGADHTVNKSLYDVQMENPSDLSIVKGVLIHLDPNKISIAYDRLHQASRRYILVAEYYNPCPVEVRYRGHDNRLFKRDFAGEMLDRFTDLSLIDYGFFYRRDPLFPQDDITWFLLEKAST